MSGQVVRCSGYILTEDELVGCLRRCGWTVVPNSLVREFWGFDQVPSFEYRFPEELRKHARQKVRYCWSAAAAEHLPVRMFERPAGVHPYPIEMFFTKAKVILPSQAEVDQWTPKDFPKEALS